MKITFNIFSVRLREGCIKDIYKNVNIKDINTIPGSSHMYLFPPVLFQIPFFVPFIYRTKKKKINVTLNVNSCKWDGKVYYGPWKQTSTK